MIENSVADSSCLYLPCNEDTQFVCEMVEEDIWAFLSLGANNVNLSFFSYPCLVIVWITSGTCNRQYMCYDRMHWTGLNYMETVRRTGYSMCVMPPLSVRNSVCV